MLGATTMWARSTVHVMLGLLEMDLLVMVSNDVVIATVLVALGTMISLTTKLASKKFKLSSFILSRNGNGNS